MSRYPAHAQTLLQHIHTERSAFAQSPRTSYRSQKTLNPVFLSFNILWTSNLHGSTSTFIKIQFDVLGQFLSDLMVETRESVGNPRSKIWVESSRYLSRWVLGDPSPSLIALGILDDGRSWESVSNPLPRWRGRWMSGRHSRASISQDLWGFAQVKITVFGGG